MGTFEIGCICPSPIGFWFYLGSLTINQTASDHLETIERLAIVLQRIVASLERCHNYEILFKNHMNTQKAIGALYVDLLDLCARMVRFYSRPSIGM